MVGPDDPRSKITAQNGRKRSKKGLEAEYDCPDCDYYQTGTTTGPHSFLDHLKEEHGYSDTEAMEILQR